MNHGKKDFPSENLIPQKLNIKDSYKGVVRYTSKYVDKKFTHKVKQNDFLVVINTVIYYNQNTKYFKFTLLCDTTLKELKNEIVNTHMKTKDSEIKLKFNDNIELDDKYLNYPLIGIPDLEDYIFKRKKINLKVVSNHDVQIPETKDSIEYSISEVDNMSSYSGSYSSYDSRPQSEKLSLKDSDNPDILDGGCLTPTASVKINIRDGKVKSGDEVLSFIDNIQELDLQTTPREDEKDFEVIDVEHKDILEELEVELTEKEREKIVENEQSNDHEIFMLEKNNEIVISGYLYKKANLQSISKQQYYFVLCSDHFIYYAKDEETYNQRKTTSFNLNGCNIKLVDNDISIRYGKTTIIIYHEDINIINQWYKHIMFHSREADIAYHSDIKFQGWLLKRGFQVKSRKKRWCILRDGHIFYYENETIAKQSNHTGYFGKVHLFECIVELDKERTNTFKIHTDFRTWIFTAATEGETYQWIKAIEDQIELFKRVSELKEIKLRVNKLDQNIKPIKRKIKVVNVDMETIYDVADHINLVEIKEMMELGHYRYVRWMLTKLRQKIQEDKHKNGALDIILAETSEYLTVDDITVKFHYNTFVCVKCVKEKPLRYGIELALSKFSKKKEIDGDLKADDFVLRLLGTRQYIIDLDVHVWSIVAIHKKLSQPGCRNMPVDLVLEKKEDIMSKVRSPLSFTNVSNVPNILIDNTLKEDVILKSKDSQKSLQTIRNAIRKGSFVPRVNSSLKLVQSPVKETEKLAEDIVEEVISIYDLKQKLFYVKVVAISNFSLSLLEGIIAHDQIDNARRNARMTFFMELGAYYGGKLIGNKERTMKSLTPTWLEVKNLGITFENLPPETRLCFTLYCNFMQKDTPLAWVNCSITDFTGKLKSGSIELSMWLNGVANPLGTTEMNPSQSLLLNVIFPTFPYPVVFPDFSIVPPYYSNILSNEEKEMQDQERLVEESLPRSSNIQSIAAFYNIDTEEEKEELSRSLREIRRISTLDPLQTLNEQEKSLLWKYRKYLNNKLEILPKLLISVNMDNIENRREIRDIVNKAPLLKPEDALQLLDYKYPDTCIRSYAVKCLSKLDDNSLCIYLLQLVQVLKYEPFHVSDLISFLLERALKSPYVIGHLLFWHFQSETHLSNVTAKFRLLQECFLLGVRPEIRQEILDEMNLLDKLNEVNIAISQVPPLERKKLLQEQLKFLELPQRFILPTDPSLVFNGINIEKCKIMDSAAFPMMIVFKNVDALAEDTYILCKYGDDLRQDSLTLQMFRFMDKLWKNEGFFLNMNIYNCVPTGKLKGLIEIVRHSETTAKIQKSAGGIIGAFKQTPLRNWLRSHNDESNWDTVVDTFIKSCAAYCVATYVIGIGDRHNDNIMVTKSGSLFHIDFAHFLGNIMKFGIYKREKAPFVMTPEFAFVMGGEKSENFNRFEDLCCAIYNIIRKNANTFISLFDLMLFAGIPQLSSPDDLQYLKKSLSLEKTDEEAEEHFIKLIDESLKTTSTQINFAFHILAHPD